jgi:hypothetical protein
MLFKTKTSIYEIKNEETGKFLLTKVAILPRCSSSVEGGESFRGDRIVITPQGLELYDEEKFVVRTSPLQI